MIWILDWGEYTGEPCMEEWVPSVGCHQGEQCAWLWRCSAAQWTGCDEDHSQTPSCHQGHRNPAPATAAKKG